MEIDFRNVPYSASVWDVKRAFGAVLHGDQFFDASDPKERPINFKIVLNKAPQGIYNNGSGKLILPDRNVGETLIKGTKNGHGPFIVVQDKTLRLYSGRSKPETKVTTLLKKTPYLDPNLEEEREMKIDTLKNDWWHIDKVQFGVFYQRKHDSPTAHRCFSNEYEMSHTNKSAGMMRIEYELKLIRMQLGDPVTEELAYNIVITFANIRKLAIGLDFGNPFVCLELLTPPVFQLERFNRTLTGEGWKDDQKYRQRLDSLNPSHALVAPYAHQMRIILHEQQDLDKFRRQCIFAGITRPMEAQIEAFSSRFYTMRKLHNIRLKLETFSWPVAFQIEAMLRNGLVNTDDLVDQLYGPIEELCREHPTHASDTLRLFTEKLRTKDRDMSILQCWRKVCLREPKPESPVLRAGDFLCHHVTVSPTRLLLEGPYVIQSNRVIREYEGYQENFIRVDFRDEDRLQYRWEKDTDGTTLLQDRVGTILKEGLHLGGRYFEFLAYSSSALREHAVWFVHPFQHAERGHIDADRIRKSLGDFSGVIRQPSKYAARMAQAFTATDPSVRIRRDQWEEVEDLGEDPYLHTDGVGTISKGLGDMIWEALCAARDDNYKRNVKPSAYQIRFLGYKGMVAVDEQLEGIFMRLRKSMNKFEGPQDELPSIEIARAFERPKTCYLNRPLVMVLEDRGVDKKAFIKLQNEAIAAIHMASDSMMQCRSLLRDHSLGPKYRLAYICQVLEAIGVGMQHEGASYTLKDSFFDRVIQFGKNSVLRSIKHAARIPVPDSYLLVGVADEGPAYEAAGLRNVFKLTEGQIFACIQTPDPDKPIYLEGIVALSRNPVVHPGDVQRVTAIGKPPDDCLCFFRNLKNCVVLPSVGPRSLASMLGGGDLDGDLYAVVTEPTLLPTVHVEPADYTPVGTHTLERESTIEDVCDFVVEYINSDILGLLSDRHLITADQSKEGTMDKDCMTLARLCSQAVDYPKNGIPVEKNKIPPRLMPVKPDWKKAEQNAPRETDYYESSRALGELFRNVTLLDPPPPIPYNANANVAPLSDSISVALKSHITLHLGEGSFHNSEDRVSEMEPLFRHYVDELKYICLTHALSDSSESRLSEEEVVIGSILASCSQHRYRSDRMYRMQFNSAVLVNDIRQKLYMKVDDPAPGQLRYGLGQAWLAWDFAMRNRGLFGANSFALITLGIIGDTLEGLGDISVRGDGVAPVEDW